MSDDGKGKAGRPRGRRRSTGLRKNQPVDGVVVEEAFPLYNGLIGSREKAGEGFYISATTSNNRRYYGVLIDQPALKVASTLYFKDQSDSLKLNERMKLLLQQKEEQRDRKLPEDDRNGYLASENTISKTIVNPNPVNTAAGPTTASKRPLKDLSTVEASQSSSERIKKARLYDGPSPDSIRSTAASAANTEPPSKVSIQEKPVQKLKYICDLSLVSRSGKEKEPGYRILVATFSDNFEAACGDPAKAEAIRSACEDGGNFLSGQFNDSYYYQYEVLPSSLTADEGSRAMLDMMRTSMGFNSFLHNTLLPPWYPLSNLHSQAKVLSMMNMKRDNKGNVKWEGIAREGDAGATTDVALLDGGTRLPMQPRSKKQFQVGVIGGGIAGLACCQELIRLLNNDGIDAKVTLLEARSRLGGRLITDRTWKSESKKDIPIELGASWIHGINDNPLATLAKSAGVDFVTASEDVKMLGIGMRGVDAEMDEKMGKLFDDLLDHAAGDCWKSKEDPSVPRESADAQEAVRWYASTFVDGNGSIKQSPQSTGPPCHRLSDDRSLDCEIGKAIANYRLRDFAKLTEEEHRMLLWNIKNVEYAIGANLNMMSTKYWDVDDRHAFDGDHVLLRTGYSTIIDHMFSNLRSMGQDKFECFLDFPVGDVEYGRKSALQPFGPDRFGRERQLAELSDTCSVASENGEVKYFDFLVCAVPLGVLKETVQRTKETGKMQGLSFKPKLPFTKVDAISNVGFGLLNKIYIRFERPFWRTASFFKHDDDCLFGNVSGIHPHHYMFFDVGRILASDGDAPAILMSLVSGNEAVAIEWKSDNEVVEEVMETLTAIFSPSLVVPDPIACKVTRWGKDRFARGSYSYLPPGSTDQDYQLLQSPINANGDSLMLEGPEVMRLYFAGEHTTALHPSTAHGAMLSGIRAAQEVVATIQGNNKDIKDVDKVIPVAMYRHQNPSATLQCHLCHVVGGQVRQGALLAFKRGARQVLVHNNCAEFCPEVEIVDAKWKNVIRAVNRGKGYTCEQCSLSGATIACSNEGCWRSYHFACAEDCGWRFDRDGKHFFCDKHRSVLTRGKECDRISIQYFAEKNPRRKLVCSLCRNTDDDSCGELLAFQSGRGQTLVHLNCVKYTSIVDTAESAESRIGSEFQNVFEAIDASKACTSCQNPGATISCFESGCGKIFHFSCAVKSNWNFERNGRNFKCTMHRMKTIRVASSNAAVDNDATTMSFENGGLTLQHNLLAHFGATSKLPGTKIVPGNLDIGGTVPPSRNDLSPEKVINIESDSEDSLPGEDALGIEVMDIPLSTDVPGPKQLVRIERRSRDEFWNVSLKFERSHGSNVVSVDSVPPDSSDLFSLRKKDILVSINGARVGSEGLLTLRDILFRMKQEVDMMLQVIRKL
ncbi:amine oxidase [Nitzschia inconspicua]|uniref:Amine oxidase n=1 Tax=Nitzschia inconspicua TaxID=303405 RepID=A0A9K3LAN5_9STRA|nr:amine oxidase [Nitzschia inconspicua]